MTERLALATKDTFRSLRIRNFRVFFIGQTISQTGTWLQLIAQTLLVLRLTGSGVALGLVTAAQFLPVLLLGAWAGVVADRVDTRRLMYATQTAMMGFALLLGGLALSGHVTVTWVYVLAALSGTANAFDNPSRRLLVSQLVSDEEVTNAVGLNAALMTASRMVGPALAGLMVATVGIGWCFVLNGVTFVAVLVALRAMDASSMRVEERAQRERGQLRAGLRYVWRTPELRSPLLIVLLVATLAYNYQVLLPLLAERTLGGSDTTYTMLASVLSLGALIGSLWLARRARIDNRLIAMGCLWFAASTAVLALSPNLAVALVAAVPVGISSMVVLSGSATLVQLAAAPAMRGRVLALFSVAFLGSTPIGGPIAGAVAEHFGTRLALGMGAAAALVGGALGLLGLARGAPAREPVAPAASCALAVSIPAGK